MGRAPAKDLIGTVSADSLNLLTKSDEGWLALSGGRGTRKDGLRQGGPMWADVSEYY